MRIVFLFCWDIFVLKIRRWFLPLENFLIDHLAVVIVNIMVISSARYDLIFNVDDIVDVVEVDRLF